MNEDIKGIINKINKDIEKSPKRKARFERCAKP